MAPEISSYLKSVIADSFTNGRIIANPDTLLLQGSQNIYLGGDSFHGGSTIVQYLSPVDYRHGITRTWYVFYNMGGEDHHPDSAELHQ